MCILLFLLFCSSLFQVPSDTLIDCLIINQIQLNESHTVHLLRGLPLLHLLRGDCAPHEQCVVCHFAIDWKDPAIDLRETQQIMTHKKGSVVVCQLESIIYHVLKQRYTSHHLCYPYICNICVTIPTGS